MAQGNNMGRTGGTIDTPVGAQWPSSGGTPGSTEFGRATETGELTSRGETLNAQPVPAADIEASADHGDYEPHTGREVVVAARPRSRPSTAAVLGSAVAGAVAGSAIPFMLAGRKSSGRTVLAQDRYEPHATQDVTDHTASSRWGRRWR